MQKIISRRECNRLFATMRSVMRQIEHGRLVISSDGTPLITIKRGVYASAPTALSLWVSSWRDMNEVCGIKVDQLPLIDLAHALRSGTRISRKMVISASKVVSDQQRQFERVNKWQQ